MSNNLITNGTFDSDAAGWTLSVGNWYAGMGDPYPGCVMLSSDDAYAEQTGITIPAAGDYILTLRLRQWGMQSSQDAAQVILMNGGIAQASGIFKLSPNIWYPLFFLAKLGVAATSLKITQKYDGGDHVYIDTVGLFAPSGTELYSIVQELQKRRDDPASIKHHTTRYEAAVNAAIAASPQRLWRPDINTSIPTVADTRRYALSITGLTEPGQVRRVWMEDTDGNDAELGRWAIENDAGTLTLVLDEDPPEAGRTLTIEFLTRPSSLSLPWEDSTLDREWLLARAMTLLLLEASPELEPAERIHQMLTYWDSLRQGRERELMGQQPRPSIRFRSTRWGDYV